MGSRDYYYLRKLGCDLAPSKLLNKLLELMMKLLASFEAKKTRTNFSTHGHAIADATNSPISLKRKNLLDRKAISNQIHIQNKSTVTSPTLQGFAYVIEDNSTLCSGSGERKPLF